MMQHPTPSQQDDHSADEQTSEQTVHIQDFDGLHGVLTVGNLRVVNCLGMGCYGAVVLVNTRSDESAIFAMKIIKKSQMYIENASSINILSAERRSLSYLPWNPFVSGVVDTFFDVQNLYLMLEVMPYGTLYNLIDEGGPFTPLTACFYYCNIFCGLEFIHSHDIVSRDLKPDNILVGHDGYLCLTDFGHAARVEDGEFWHVVGTPSYMAPELIGNLHPPGEAVDWWASGVILYEMLSKQLPFHGSAEEAVFANVMSLNYSWPEVPLGNSLKHFISRLLTFHPEKRLGFQGATEVASHPWLSHVDWVQMKGKTYDAPWVPAETELANKWGRHSVPRKRSMGNLYIRRPPVHLRRDKRFLERRFLE